MKTKHNKPVLVYFSTTEKEQIQKIADGMHFPLATFIRWSVFEQVYLRELKMKKAG